MTTENMQNGNGATEESKKVAADGQATNGVASGEATVDPLKAAEEKVKEWEKKYLYLYSDFENFRRRAEKDRLEFLKFGHEGFLRDLLQVQDNFDRAVAHAKSAVEQDKDNKLLAQVAQGVEMIQYQFSETLKNQGVTELKSLGEKFNPQFHEAVSEEVSAGAEPGTVLKELTKAYLLHGRLLRAAKVVTVKAGS